MKRLYLLLTLTLTLACQHSAQHRELAAGTWDAQVRNQLNDLLETCQDSGAYAVFDFDKTSIVHDVSQALWVYQIEHLRYADAPDHGFLDGIPDASQPIGGITFSQMGEVLKEEYAQLAALQVEGKTLEQIHATDTYKDFRGRCFWI